MKSPRGDIFRTISKSDAPSKATAARVDQAVVISEDTSIPRIPASHASTKGASSFAQQASRSQPPEAHLNIHYTPFLSESIYHTNTIQSSYLIITGVRVLRLGFRVQVLGFSRSFLE